MAIVSIVSKQIIPNLLLIKELRAAEQNHYFITTEEMENQKKSEAIIRAAGIPGDKVNIIKVSWENPRDILSVFNQYFSHAPDEHFHVNLTGGTKIMSLMVYEYFRDKPSTFYYVPLGGKYYEQFDRNLKPRFQALFYRLTLNDYFSCCGLRFESRDEMAFVQKKAFEIFNKFKGNGFHRENFPWRIARNNLNLPVNDDNLIGTWFEEFVFYYFKEKYNLNDNYIRCGVKIYDPENVFNDNEVDVMFVYENKLHLIECKAFISGGTQWNRIQHICYRLALINKYFDLNTIAFMSTLERMRRNNGDFSPELKRKCELLNLQLPMDVHDFLNIQVNP